MADKTRIEWTDATWNPVTGCTKVSAGCKHWVVAGGESGAKARPMDLDWARTLRDQCAAAGVPFIFKQWGEFWPAILDRKPPEVIMCRVGKKLAGRVLDGIEHNGYPETS